MLHGEAEYRRRAREKAAQDKQEADRERDKAAEYAHKQKIVVALNSLNEKIDGYQNQPHPKPKREWPWKLAETLGLWLAAAVGAIAVLVGNHDATDQRTVMQGQLDSMENAQRPWISFSADLVPIKSGEPLKLTIQWKNVGHTPAFQMFNQSWLWPVKKGESPPGALTKLGVIPNGGAIKSHGFLLPGQFANQNVSWNNGILLTTDDIKLLEDNQITLWSGGIY
jgi:hypothetical protein